MEIYELIALIGFIILEIILRLKPSYKNLSVIDFLYRIFDFFIPNKIDIRDQSGKTKKFKTKSRSSVNQDSK